MGGLEYTFDFELDYETENPIIKFSTVYYNAISHKTSMMMTGAGCWSALCSEVQAGTTTKQSVVPVLCDVK